MASMIVKHPAFDDVTETVDESVLEEWKAAGWKPLLDDEQQARFDELEAEVATDDTPPANDSSDDDTPTAADEDDASSAPRTRKPRSTP